MVGVPVLARPHAAVLAALAWLPEDQAVDVALLDVPEVDAARFLGELEETGCVASARGPLQ